MNHDELITCYDNLEGFAKEKLDRVLIVLHY